MDIFRNTHLWQVPMIKSHNGSDIIFKQLINKSIVILHSFLIHMVSCKYTKVEVKHFGNISKSYLELAVWILTPDSSWHDPRPGDGKPIMI